MRYLGLDLGSKTLGVAISLTGIIANGYGTIRHDENYDYLVNEVKKIVLLNNISTIVLGLPKNMNNTIGVKGELSEQFKTKLEKELNIPVYLEDERLTTVMATNMLIDNDTRRNKRKKVVDKLAATVILQSFLDKKGK